MKFGHKKQQTLGYHAVKTGVSVSPGLESVPGCDRQTDRITIASTRLRAVASKNLNDDAETILPSPPRAVKMKLNKMSS